MSEHLVFTENKKTGDLRYNRFSSGIQYRLECEISNLYKQKGNKACMCSSGLASIDALFHSLFISNKWNPCNIVYSDEIYTETIRLFDSFKKDYGALADIYEVDICDDRKVLDTFSSIKDSPTIFFLESCSNPNGYIFNWDLITQIRSMCKKVIIVVDNTWLTSKVFNPLDVGADYVIASVTKYYSASACIGGFVVGNDVRAVSNWLRNHGAHVSPHHCKLVLDALRTLDQRMSMKEVLTVANYLESNTKILRCNYPLLPTHPSYEIASKYWNKGYYPSVLTFSIEGMNISRTRDWLKSHRSLINYKTSFGGQDSRFDPWPGETITDGAQGKYMYSTIRLSVGYKDGGALVDKLKKIFALEIF